jgi:RNA polymerase sigma-70 factor (ECF subfamily)
LKSEDLLRGLRESSPEAISQFCTSFGPKLVRFVQSWLVGDRPAAEEVTVLALLDGVRNISRYDPARASLSAWLFGIARRKLQDELRRRKRRKSVPAAAEVPVDALGDMAGDEDLAEVVAARVAAQRQVADLSRALLPLEFEVLMLNCADELTAPEIGRIVGKSERAVHSILFRARKKARERLAQDG